MSSCKRQTAKRYQERPSPPYKAGHCPGATKTGNDGTPYASVANAKGVYHWVKQGGHLKRTRQTKKTRQTKTKVYRTLDNGGYPYRVTIDPSHIQVEHLTYDYSDGDLTKEPATATPVYNISNFKNLWIGQGIDMFHPKDVDPSFIGNSIVAQKNDNTCLFIGTKVVEFDRVPGDSFDSATLHSHVGSNAVPYPYLTTATHTYFLLDFVAVPNALLDFTDQDENDCYDQFYGITPHAGGKISRLRKQGIKLKVNVIHRAK